MTAGDPEDRAFRAHPWHGVSMGKDAPRVVTTYIEIVPTDTVKYEMDKLTGILRMDRPQQYSNVCPSLYGFIPRTLCAERVGALCSERTGRPGIQGDGDPMDVCVLTEKEISHGDILVQAIPIGGLRMIDGTGSRRQGDRGAEWRCGVRFYPAKSRTVRLRSWTGYVTTS
mgnify:CR=1 FL=1